MESFVIVIASLIIELSSPTWYRLQNQHPALFPLHPSALDHLPHRNYALDYHFLLQVFIGRLIVVLPKLIMLPEQLEQFMLRPSQQLLLQAIAIVIAIAIIVLLWLLIWW